MAVWIIMGCSAYFVVGVAFVWALAAAFDVPLRETDAADVPSIIACALIWPVVGLILAYMYQDAITARVKAAWRHLRKRRITSTIAVILIACLMFSGCSGCTSFNDVRAGMVASHVEAIQTSTNKVHNIGSPDWDRVIEAERRAESNQMYQITITAPRSAFKIRKVEP